jgi:hypothetical protein
MCSSSAAFEWDCPISGVQLAGCPCRSVGTRPGAFGLDYGAWQTGTPTENQMRNALRHLDGIEARERNARKRRAEDGSVALLVIAPEP